MRAFRAINKISSQRSTDLGMASSFVTGNIRTSSSSPSCNNEPFEQPTAYRLSLIAGFTYIELLVSLSILAILFVPMMQLYSQAMGASSTSRELITASFLARWEMERVKNLNLTKEQLRDLGDTLWPPEEKEPWELNGSLWRIERKLKPGTDPLEVSVMVRKDGSKQKVVELVTLIEDMAWEEQKVI